MATKTSTSYKRVDGVSYTAAAGHAKTDRGGLVALTRTRTGVPQPKYRQIIQNEGNATTSMTASEESLTIIPGFIKYTFPDNSSYVETDQGIVPGNVKSTPIVITDSMRAEAEAKATSSIYKAIRAFQTPFEGQIFAGELKETFELIKNPLGKSAKLTDEFIRALSKDRSRAKFVANSGLRGGLTPLSKAAADSWLEYSFGIMPLINDVKDLLSLAEKVAERHEHETIRGYGKSETSSSQVLRNQSSFVNGIGGYQTVDCTSKVECIIRCGLTAKFLDQVREKRSPYWDSFDDITSIPVTAWELIPFSFLIDYFANVGDIISSAVVTQSGLSYTSKSLVETKRVIRTSITTGPDGNGNVKSVGATTPKGSAYQIRSVTRTNTLAAIPPLVFSLPGSNVRYANITALLTRFLT